MIWKNVLQAVITPALAKMVHQHPGKNQLRPTLLSRAVVRLQWRDAECRKDVFKRFFEKKKWFFGLVVTWPVNIHNHSVPIDIQAGVLWGKNWIVPAGKVRIETFAKPAAGTNHQKLGLLLERWGHRKGCRFVWRVGVRARLIWFY